MYNELLKTKEDVYFFLREERDLLYYKAQEAEDLKNLKGAAEIRAIAEQMDKAAKRLVKELNSENERKS